jgi:hypothetical protein
MRTCGIENQPQEGNVVPKPTTSKVRKPDPEIIVGRGKLRVMLDASYVEIDLRTERVRQYGKETATKR